MIGQLLAFASNSDREFRNKNWKTGLMWVGILIGLNLCRILLDTVHWSLNLQTATRARSGILAMVFQRVAKLRSLQERSVGEVMIIIIIIIIIIIRTYSDSRNK